MNRRSWFVLIGVLAAGLAGLLWLTARHEDSRALVPPVVRSASTNAPDVELESLTAPSSSADASPQRASSSTPERGAVEVAQPRTVEAVCRDFWGPRWDEMRPLLETRMSLSTMMDIPLPPWEDVRPQVCAKMVVREDQLDALRHLYCPPEPLTLAWFAQEHGSPGGVALTEHDAIEVRARLTDVSADARSALSEYETGINNVLAGRCARTDYNYAPIADIEKTKTPKDAIFVTSFSISGWVISCGVAPSEDPRLADAYNRIKDIKPRFKKVIFDYMVERTRALPK